MKKRANGLRMTGMIITAAALTASAAAMWGCRSGTAAVKSGGVGELVLVAGATGQCAIVLADGATAAEQFAAEELASFIRRGTGAGLPILKESEFKGARGIYVGQTRLAQKSGAAFEKLGPEEWFICSARDSLVISGGRPRGTLYGAYEFLERAAGIRFLDAWSEHVPQRPTLSVPGDFALRSGPAFARREIYIVSGQSNQVLFQVRHKINSFANAYKSGEAKYGYAMRFGSPYSTHTHAYYAEAFPSNHPEYCAMDANGKRAAPPSPDCKGRWDHQVCMSNPEVRKFFAARLREYIKADRDRIMKEGKGEPFPALYSLVPSDNVNKCLCPACKAAADKYGAYSGLLIEFVNTIADDIAAVHPEIRLTIGAYTFYADAPKGIKPRDNVIVYIAQLGAEFNALPKRDALRSMEHPLNAKAKQMWLDWSKVSRSLGVHDYWTAWSQPHLWPHANIQGLAQTLKFYHRCGLQHFFVEDELMGSRIHNFVDLQFYLAAKLFQNPLQDEQPIIDEFMELYYGPAAPDMKKLLACIEKRQEEERGMLTAVPPSSRKYFETRFFVEADKIISESEKKVSGNPKLLANVQQERLAFDEALLFLWKKLEKEGPLPFKRGEILARLRQGYEAAYKKYGGWGENARKADVERLAYLENMPAVPEQFEGKKIIDVANPHLFGGNQARRVDDPQAAMGKAWRLDAAMKGTEGNHDKLPEFGLSDCVSAPKFITRQVMAREKIPADEKYHWQFAGRMKATTTMYFWAHSSWGLAMRLFMAYDASLPEQKTYDVYASIKLEGPAYVSGSHKTNAFAIDRLILVEVE